MPQSSKFCVGQRSATTCIVEADGSRRPRAGALHVRPNLLYWFPAMQDVMERPGLTTVDDPLAECVTYRFQNEVIAHAASSMASVAGLYRSGSTPSRRTHARFDCGRAEREWVSAWHVSKKLMWVHARLISRMPILTADRSALLRASALRLALHNDNLPIPNLAAFADAAPQCAIIGVLSAGSIIPTRLWVCRRVAAAFGLRLH